MYEIRTKPPGGRHAFDQRLPVVSSWIAGVANLFSYHLASSGEFPHQISFEAHGYASDDEAMAAIRLMHTLSFLNELNKDQFGWLGVAALGFAHRELAALALLNLSADI